MRLLSVFVLAAASLAAVSASAQVLNLSGQFVCVQGCAGGAPAFIAQSDWDMNLVNEAGMPSRAWIDHPGHIWVQSWYEGAVYSPDGMTIQFDRGTVWQRDLGQGLMGAVVVPAVPAVAAPVVAAPPVAETAVATPAINPRPTPASRTAVERAPARVNAFDGDWSVVILTNSGSCDPSYRYGVRIYNGNVVNDYGQSVDVQGHVWPNGAVRVALAAGGQSASGSGRLSTTSGTGTWSGQGSAGYCAGVWQAMRRG